MVWPEASSESPDVGSVSTLSDRLDGLFSQPQTNLQYQVLFRLTVTNNVLASAFRSPCFFLRKKVGKKPDGNVYAEVPAPVTLFLGLAYQRRLLQSEV